MFDLSTLALKSEATDVQLRHPVTDDLLWDNPEAQEGPVVISVYGPGSKPHRDAITAMQNKALKRGKKAVLTAEQLKQEGIDLLVACSAGSKNFQYNGQAVESPAQFRSLYADPAFSWLKEQIDSAIGDVSNFLGQ